MIPKYVLVWAKQYFYTTIGLDAPEHLTFEMEQEAVRGYTDKFAKPVSYMLKGVEAQDLTKEDINSFLVTMRMSRVPTILHYLKPMVDYGWFVFTGNLEEDLKAAVNTMKERCKENYYIVKGGTPFKGYYSNSEKVIFDVPSKVICLGEARRFRQGLTLQGLREADPIRSNDFVIRAIKTCVEEGILNSSELTSVFYCVPSQDGFNTVPVTAITPELPSFATRKLISCLPDSYVQEYASPYHAALQYALEHDEYNRCLNELKDIVGQIDETTPTSGLNDDMVMEYLHKKYGIANETLQSLFIPISSKIYSSTYLLDNESKNMTAEEFIEKVASESNYAQGSFDELILAYCTSENVDLKCTIEQLISSITYEVPVSPKTFPELAKEFKEENSLSGETTLSELIESKPHVYVDNIDITMDVINNCSGFSDECKKLIHDVIFDVDEKTKMEMPDLSTELADLGIPDDLMTAILIAEQTGKPIVLPERPKQEIAEEDVITYLVRAGIPRVDAKSLVKGEIPMSMENDVNQQMHDILRNHYSEDDVTSLMQGKGLLPSTDRARVILKELGVSEESINATLSGEAVVPAGTISKEPGYRVANSLLTDIRRSISNNDSDELRTNLLPILYSYMRVLMMNSGDKEDVIDFLNKKKKECKVEIAGFIDNAISMLRE